MFLDYKQLPRVTYGQAVRSDTKYVLVVNVGQNVQPHDLTRSPFSKTLVECVAG
jgi:hypothetical protein